MIRHIIVAIIVITSLGCQQAKKNILTHEVIELETSILFDEIVEIRRNFHQYPELAGNEKKSQKFIEEYLMELGIEIIPDVYGHGVIGVLRGNNEGKKIAWRADMDALPHDFPDEVEFKSKAKGIQHGCGHDIHMAIGLGIAKIFAKHKESINGTVYFIFQPEEETFVGARKMVESGLISKLDLDEIYGLHVTALPVGKIMVKSNEIYAYQKRVQIRLKNNISVDEQEILYEIVKENISRLQPDSKPWVIQSAFDMSNGLTNPNTIFKDYRFMDDKPTLSVEEDDIYIKAYLYETNQASISEILPKISQIIDGTKYKNILRSVSFIQENPTVFNDEGLTNKSIETLSKIYGNDLMLPDYGQVPYFNDDFCYFQQNTPSVYFLLGGSNDEKGIVAMNHAPNFRVDEDCMKTGIKSFSSLILERLNAIE